MCVETMICLTRLHLLIIIILLDAGFAALVYLVMLLLLSQQMSESRSPAALSRISRWSFIAQALADSIAFACVGLCDW
jgi:hypothetical protein